MPHAKHRFPDAAPRNSLGFFAFAQSVNPNKIYGKALHRSRYFYLVGGFFKKFTINPQTSPKPTTALSNIIDSFVCEGALCKRSLLAGFRMPDASRIRTLHAKLMYFEPVVLAH